MELEVLPGQDRDHPYVLAARAMIMNDLGLHEEAEAAPRRVGGPVDENQRNEAYAVAEAYAWIGQIDAAFERLEKAYALDGTFGMQGYWFHRIMFLPIWRNLHGDPRWDALRGRMNMSPARLEALEFTIPPWISLAVE